MKPLELVNVIDPRLKCMKYAQEKLEYGVTKGAEYSNWVRQQANSYSTASVSFNFNTQGVNTMIDRRLYCKIQFQLTLTGVPVNGGRLVNPGLSAPRAFPLASICENVSVNINGNTVSMAYADALQAMWRYSNNYEDFEYDLSTTPNYLDVYQEYAAGVGSLRNPLNDFQNSGYELGRGAFALDNIVNPVGDGVNPVTAVVLFTVTEPIFVSPLLYKSQCLEQALIGVKNMGVQLNFGGNLNRVWSHALGLAGETVTAATVAIGAGTTTQPELLVNYLNTPLIDESMIPREVNYDYMRIESFVNDQNVNLNAGTSQTFTNNSIQLGTVPKSIWIYVNEPRGQKNLFSTDTFFRINSISLQYLNVSGQFSSMSIQDLYQLSVKNGCKMSFTEWTGLTVLNTGTTLGLTGSVLKIDCTDLALPSNLASGVNINSQLQFSINVTNTGSQAKQVQIVTVIATEGLFTVADGSSYSQLGVITQEDVLRTRSDESEWRDFNMQGTLYGGSFWSGLKNFGKSLGHAILKYGPKALKLAPLIGLGMDEDQMNEMQGSAMVGGKKHNKGGAIVGGKMLSRTQLKKMLEE
jgi:hypothetical protein